MRENSIINLGTLSSLNLLYSNLGYKLKEINSLKKEFDLVWDLRQLEAKRINLAALTSFLSISYGLSRDIGNPIPILLDWNPYIIKFLYTIGFFEAARELEILTWDERIIGGLPRTSFNPNNKILSFYNVPDKVDYKNQVQLNIIKEELRQECYETILAKFKLLFSYSDINYVFDPDLVYFLCTNCAELIVNGLIHGRTPVFLGMQRTSVGISICIADSGIGFLQSMQESNPWTRKKGINRNVDALVIASLLPKNQICLRDVINSILKIRGWVIMSSIDCELRWEYNKWQRSLDILEDLGNIPTNRIAEEVIGTELTTYVSRENLRKGYFKINKFEFPGSRITFEISFL